MITYWQQVNNQFVKTKKDAIIDNQPLWVDARNVTRDETTELQSEYDIDNDHILDILDPDELSRLEEGEGYILTIVRVPNYDSNAETTQALTNGFKQRTQNIRSKADNVVVALLDPGKIPVPIERT